MEILRWLVEYFEREGRVIRQSPVPFLVALMILGALIFGAVEWHFSGSERAQLATIALLQEQLRQASRLSSSPIVVSPADVLSLQSPDRASLQRTIFATTEALRRLDATIQNEKTRIIFQKIPEQANQQLFQQQWDARNARSFELDRKLNFEWQTRYRAQARAQYEELCRRLGMLPDQFVNFSNDQRNVQAAKELLTNGMLAGVTPISSLADYLDSLARQLDNL